MIAGLSGADHRRMSERFLKGRLTVLMITAFVDMMGFVIVLPLLPFYASKLGGSATVVGGLLFGLVEVFAQSIPGSGSVYANAIAFGLLVLVLVTRPQGLLGRRP